VEKKDVNPSIESLVNADGPVCLIIKATLTPIGDIGRFQPAGFPEVGHVIYDAPRSDGSGNRFKEKVCIVDSPASMANHLESVCLTGGGGMELHSDLKELPYVICETDDKGVPSDGIERMPLRVDIVSTFTEGHRLASDYFLDATMDEKSFREVLRDGFKIVEVKKDKTYFIPPATWWDIYKTIFKYDPNSLVHGVMFAKEQIKISRLLTAHHEAFGASRVGRSGVKFDRLGKTTSGQPIFSVDEETAQEIRATFIIDLALLRSYGRNEKGLSLPQKCLLLNLALWKIRQLLARPFRFRTQCFLGCVRVQIETESGVLQKAPCSVTNEEGDDVDESDTKRADNASSGVEPEAPTLLKEFPDLLANIDISSSIARCKFGAKEPTRVYYPADRLYKAGKDDNENDNENEG
jgi:CRISPR-associated protein Csb1